MFIRFFIKFLLRKKLEDHISEGTRILILESLKKNFIYHRNKEYVFYHTNFHFLIALTNYYIKRKKFTYIHLNAMKRLTSG